MNKKWIASLLAVVMLLALIVVPGMAMAEGEEAAAEPAKEIVILYTNDTHCGVQDGMGIVGLARIKAALEAAGKEVILVDCGDAVQGGVIGTLSKGEAIIDLMNAVGYEVATIGNHEFDYGMDQFNSNVARANFKYVACNFTDLEGNTILAPYTILERGGRKIAFVGIATPQTFKTSTPTYFMDENKQFIYSFCQGNNGQDLYDAVQKAVDAARADGAEIVVALSHLGIEWEASPWTSSEVITKTEGIDIVLDGHSHSIIEADTVKNKNGAKITLTSTGTKYDNVGMLTIAPDGAMKTRLISASAMQFLDMVGELPENNGIADALAVEVAKNQELLQKVVAHTEVELVINDPVLVDANGKHVRIVRSQETNLGDLCADAYRAMGESDVAFVNGGGVRATIPAGDITYEQIISVHPFGNVMCVVEATGQEILDALEFSCKSLPGEFGGFLQVSGLKFNVDITIPSPIEVDEGGFFVAVNGERRVKDVQVLQADGSYAPIEADKIYTVACHNYLLKNMGDGYTMFADNNILRDEVMIDNQVLINYIVDVLGGNVGSEYSNPYGQGRFVIQ